jgi:glutaminyl-peptide cyclotransferase
MKIRFCCLLCVIITVACNNPNTENNNTSSSVGSNVPATLNYNIVNVYPHDTAAFTEGLEWRNNVLYESTGNKGKSKLAKVSLTDGKDLKRIDLAKEFFGEGITILNSKIYQLTYQENKCFVYDLNTFSKIGEFTYEGEGWGMTNDGKNLIMTNGSNNLYFRDAATFKILNIVGVSDNNGALSSINELEYINGFVFANVWMTNKIVKIDIQSGKVVAQADFTGLLEKYAPDYAKRVDVLNGIAYDSVGQRFFITGKLWPKLFEVKM